MVICHVYSFLSVYRGTSNWQLPFAWCYMKSNGASNKVQSFLTQQTNTHSLQINQTLALVPMARVTFWGRLEMQAFLLASFLNTR